MPNLFFNFKQFTVYQDKCAMKVGIDGVLLGAWAPVEEAQKILDIGTGTGLIALMLAQRSKAEILGIDIDNKAFLQATENIKNAPWSNRITLIENSIQEFSESTTKRFDLIVSNPPYFVDSFKSPSESRTKARHTDFLLHEDLIICSKRLLTTKGRICLILPVIEGLRCIDFGERLGLFCSKLVKVIPKPGAVPKRILIEFSQFYSKKVEYELLIETENRHSYSEEFTQLAKDFYIKL